jgi:hypothetical protein
MHEQNVNRVPCYGFTRIDNPVPIAKAYRLSQDGEHAEKDVELSQKRLSSCTDACIECQSLTLQDIADLFDRLTTSQAVMYGMPKNGELVGRLVSKSVAKSEDIPPTGTDTIALRTRDCFEYPAGPALFMCDHDPKGEAVQSFVPPGSHEKCAQQLSDAELIELLYEVMPELRTAPGILRPSGSTWMCRKRDGKQLRGAGGVRLLIGIDDGTLIPGFAATLFERFVAANLVYIEYSNSGSLLARTLIDFAVFQPERLDFIGGAEVGEGLERNPPPTRTMNAEVPPLDVGALLDPSEFGDTAKERREAGAKQLREERRAFIRRIRAAFPEVREKSAEIRSQWLQARITTAKSRAASDKRSPLTRAEEREIELQHERIARYLDHERTPFLLGRFVLPNIATVAQVLDDPHAYVGCEMPDPLEPDYDGGRPVATVLIGDDGVPYIVSQAHGAHAYRLYRTLWDVPAPGIEQCVTVSAAGLHDDMLRQDETCVTTRYEQETCALSFEHHGVFPSEAADGFTLPLPACDADDDEEAVSAATRPPHTLVVVHPTWFVSPADSRVPQPGPRRLAPGVYRFKPMRTTIEIVSDGKNGEEVTRKETVFAGWQPVRLCSAVVTYAEASTHGRRAVVLLVHDSAQDWHKITVPVTEYARGGKLESLLREAGLHGFFASQWSVVHDLLSIQQQRSTKRELLHTLGWFDDKFERFVTPQGLVSKEHGTSSVPPITEFTQDVKRAFSSAGTLDGWQQAAALAHGDWVFSVALAAAFAAPLLRMLDITGAGIHLWGPSGVGKSTPLRLARSVWGPPELPSWDSTYNGAVAAATMAQDMLTIFDEIGSATDIGVPPKLAYALVNGSERTRAKQDGSARSPRQFRTVVLSSGECAMHVAATKSGNSWHEGQEIRFLDIEVPSAPAERSKKFKELGAREFSQQVSAVLSEQHGHAGPLFVGQLFRMAEIFSGWDTKDKFFKFGIKDVRTLVQRFHQEPDARLFKPDNVADNVLRARQQFVLFATAGELAIRMGVLGDVWMPGDMTEACGRAYSAWLNARAERGALSLSGETIRAEQTLRDFIERTSGRWATKKEDELTSMQVGWTYVLLGIGTAYCVLDGKLKDEGCEFSGPELSRLLLDRGMVLSGMNIVAAGKANKFPARFGGKVRKVRGFMLPFTQPDELTCVDDEQPWSSLFSPLKVVQ